MNRLLAALLCGGASAALAQAAAFPPLELEQLALDPGGRGSVAVANGQTLAGGDFRVSAVLQYSQGPLQSTGDTGRTQLLSDRFALHVLGAVGITKWLEFDADVPVILFQRGDGLRPSSEGLGTPWVGAKVGILDQHHFVALSSEFALGIPVGSPGALGNGGLEFSPRLNAGRNFEQVQLGLELGALIRPSVSLEAFTGSLRDRVGSQLYLAAMATGVGDGVRGEASLRGFVSFVGGPPGLELLAGVRWPIRSLELFAVMGPGIGGAPTTPNFRVYAGVAFGHVAPPRGRCDPTTDYEVTDCPNLDKDGDGVLNGVDLAPLLPEDKDGFEDEDGKPEPDNDLDGILDGDDKCPNVKGPIENQGCP